MKPWRFDDVPKALALAGSRRAFLGRAIGLASAGVRARWSWAAAFISGWGPPCRRDADCGPCERCLRTAAMCQPSCGNSPEYRCCPGRGPRGYRCAYLRTEEEHCGASGRTCGAGEFEVPGTPSP